MGWKPMVLGMGLIVCDSVGSPWYCVGLIVYDSAGSSWYWAVGLICWKPIDTKFNDPTTIGLSTMGFQPMDISPIGFKPVNKKVPLT